MPNMYSDIEISGKIVIQDPHLLRQIGRELDEIMQKGGCETYRALRDLSCEVNHIIERLESMNVL